MNSVLTLVRFVRQSGHHGDCSVSTLAMLAGVMYEDALLAAAKVNPQVLYTGMTWHQIRATARRLGLKTRTIHKYDDEATGILHVSRVALGIDGQLSEHVVFLWEGRVIDGNGELWVDLMDYLRHYGWEPRALLVVVEAS
jgi:hypothetical protein